MEGFMKGDLCCHIADYLRPLSLFLTIAYLVSSEFIAFFGLVLIAYCDDIATPKGFTGLSIATLGTLATAIVLVNAICFNLSSTACFLFLLIPFLLILLLVIYKFSKENKTT